MATCTSPFQGWSPCDIVTATMLSFTKPHLLWITPTQQLPPQGPGVHHLNHWRTNHVWQEEVTTPWQKDRLSQSIWDDWAVKVVVILCFAYQCLHHPSIIPSVTTYLSSINLSSTIYPPINPSVIYLSSINQSSDYHLFICHLTFIRSIKCYFWKQNQSKEWTNSWILRPFSWAPLRSQSESLFLLVRDSLGNSLVLGAVTCKAMAASALLGAVQVREWVS
jgi:hypothetical protein